MIFRTYHDGSMYVIEAPEGSKFISENDQIDELIHFETLPGGAIIERRLPTSVVVKAADRGSRGLSIRERRSPWVHPEVDQPCPAGS